MNPYFKQLILAIYRGDMDRIEGLMSDPVSSEALALTINYPLSAQDIESIKRDINACPDAPYPGLIHNGSPETGMTALLLALSVERLSIAERLIEHFEREIDCGCSNDNQINALHMLFMISIGDHRYAEDGQARGIEQAPPELGAQLARFSLTLIEHGHPITPIDIDGKKTQLSSIAIMHGHFQAAKAMVDIGLRPPIASQDIECLKPYFISNCPRDEAHQRFDEVCSILMPRPFATGIAFFTPQEIAFPTASLIKEMLLQFGIDRWGDSTTIMDPHQLTPLLNAYIDTAIENGIALSCADFKDWITEGLGRKLHAGIQDILLSDARFSIRASQTLTTS